MSWPKAFFPSSPVKSYSARHFCVGTATADPAGAMKWLIEVIQDTVKTPIAIDSQKFDVVKAGLSVIKNEVLINSSKGDPEELDKYMSIAKEHNASLICLTMDKCGIPQDVERRMEIAMKIVEKAVEHEFELSKIYIDPVLFPINVDQKQPALMFDIFNQIKMISDPSPQSPCVFQHPEEYHICPL